ncbi:MAG: urease accessory protein UreF, partial [Candidatus Poribacteria bacterium]|nr:urease accessory protein UreF [Candidatus Poribacteria bacterium]
MPTDSTLTSESLLALLQFTDSFFPTGAFAHSFGLESYVQDGSVHNRETLESFLRAALHYGIRTGDALAVASAYHATEVNRIEHLDQRLSAMKISRESREGSVKIGKQFLRNAGTFAESEMLDEYLKRIQSGKCAGHHAIAYGLVASGAKIDLRSTLLGYLHAFVVNQVSAAVRLIPLKPTDGQRIIQHVRSDLIEVGDFACIAVMEDLGGFTPGLDIQSMRHESLYSR